MWFAGIIIPRAHAKMQMRQFKLLASGMATHWMVMFNGWQKCVEYGIIYTIIIMVKMQAMTLAAHHRPRKGETT